MEIDTITNGEIFLFVPKLRQLVERDFAIEGTYKLTKILQALEDEFTTIDKMRWKLLNKYGEKDDKGNLIIEKAVSPEGDPVEGYKLVDTETFKKEWDKLLQKKQKFELPKLKLKDLGDSIQISVADLYPLLKLGLIED